MTDDRRSITVLGSTGSVGAKTVTILEERGGAATFNVVALTGGRNIERLAEQAISLKADIAVTAYSECHAELQERLKNETTEVASGSEALAEAAGRPADWTMSAIVGFAGLVPGLRCLERGGAMALANKESLVAAGRLVTSTANRSGAILLPVDSEHSAMFQLLANVKPQEIESLILTASGGPFRHLTTGELAKVTPKQAARHPTWNMGMRISIDSATMFNKALGMIEAHELFETPADSIGVLVHPQSIVHALIGFHDGQMLAHMSSTDMRGAIEYAMNWPNRLPSRLRRLDLAALGKLEFEEPDEVRFPATRLAREVLRIGGFAGAAFNGAKEAALDAFLLGNINFTGMSCAVDEVLNSMAGDGSLCGEALELKEIMEVDRLARIRVEEYISRGLGQD